MQKSFYGRAMSTMAAVAAMFGTISRSGPNVALPPVRQHRHGQRTPPGFDMRYVGAAWKRVASGKDFPHSSERQIARFRKNYGSEDGVIFPISRYMRREIARIQKENAA